MLATVEKAAFIPSEEQQAIYDNVEARRVKPGRKALGVRARAGTGKTTTIVQLIRRVPVCVGIYCAFNKPIAEEVKPKLAGTKVEARTFHSMGYGTLLSHLKEKFDVAKFKTDENKYKTIIAEIVLQHEKDPALKSAVRDVAEQLVLGEGGAGTSAFVSAAQQQIADQEADVFYEMRAMLKEVTRFARLKLTEWDDIQGLSRLVSEYDLNRFESDLNYDLCQRYVTAAMRLVKDIMQAAERGARKGEIDFTDMIYWNVRWNLTLPKYEWIFVDESQDLSPMQREMIFRSQAETCFTVIVGDDRQAVYRFAGADSDSWDLTIAKFNAEVLPLTVTRRCGAVITRHARTIVPDFRALPDAPRGKIVWWDEERFAEVVKPGDLVVCRLKAPVISGCLELLAKNIPATVIGIDIGKSLIGILEKIQKRPGFTFDQAVKHIEAYALKEAAKWMKKGDESRAEKIRDECEALSYIIEEMHPKPASVADVQTYISNLFAEAEDGTASVVCFATGHKSKGLQADRVFIKAPEKMPLRFKKMGMEQAVQEDNLYYVASTRAIDTLVFLTNEKFLYPGGKQKPARPKPDYVQTDFNDHDWSNEDDEDEPMEREYDNADRAAMHGRAQVEIASMMGDEPEDDEADNGYGPFGDDFEPVNPQFEISPAGEKPVYPPALDEGDLWEFHADTLPAPEPVEPLPEAGSAVVPLKPGDSIIIEASDLPATVNAAPFADGMVSVMTEDGSYTVVPTTGVKRVEALPDRELPAPAPTSKPLVVTTVPNTPSVDSRHRVMELVERLTLPEAELMAEIIAGVIARKKAGMA